MKVYVIHYKGFEDRIGKIVKLLTICNSVEDIEIITSENSSVKFATAEDNTTGRWLDILPDGFLKNPTTKPEQSICHKHFRAFKKIADGGELAIVLEDDVLFDPADFDRFVKECEEMPADLDWGFFGTGVGLELPGVGFIKNENKLKSKCADSMLVTPKAAQIVYDDLANGMIHVALDWDLNYRFLKHDFTIYWYEPGIVKQGSENGVYTNNRRKLEHKNQI